MSDQLNLSVMLVVKIVRITRIAISITYFYDSNTSNADDLHNNI